MDYLKKLFSLRGRKGKKKTEKIQSRPYDPNVTLHIPRSERDSEVAVSKLLRSSSTHFNVVKEVDYKSLPPIPHPINTISSRSSLAPSPSRSPSIQTKSSFTVTVHSRQQLSCTEFPNANPPLRDSLVTPRRFDYKSTPNLHEKSDQPRRRQVSDPRKIPFTPRDQNRLNRLRQDPSVVSLLNMYDDKGQLDEHAFSNTPPSNSYNALTRNRRDSTFKELLGKSNMEDEAFEGDLSWAERCIAESNASVSSLSTISSPALETPILNNFDSGPKENVDTTFSTDSSATYPAISSLVVELSIDEDEDTKSYTRTNADTPIITEPKRSVTRTPSQRASQVFNFISERQERRKSIGPMEALAPTTERTSQLNEQTTDDSTDIGIGQPIISSFNIPRILIDEYCSPECHDNALTSDHLASLALPGPVPPSPLVFQPLHPAPRRVSRSTSAADVLRSELYGSESDTSQMRRQSRVSGALLNKKSMFGVRARDTQRYEANAHNPRERTSHKLQGHHLPCVISEVPGSKKRPAFSVITNDGAVSRIREKNFTSISTRSSHAGRLTGEIYGADPSIDAIRNFRVVPNCRANSNTGICEEDMKVNGFEIRPDLARSATSSRYETKMSSSNGVPMTPIRSRSLFEAPSPASSSELSPEAKQLMSDLRVRKMKARQVQRENERRAMRALH